MSVGSMRLDLGGVDLVGADGGYGSFAFSTRGEDVDFGEPQPIDLTIATLMGDGSRTDTTRYDNREITFRVVLSGTHAQAVAAGEAALMVQVGVRTTLSWTPPDGCGPATVFDVETSRMKLLFSDLDEVSDIRRRTYQLTLTCLPFGRSAAETTASTDSVSSTVTIADECESTSGWSNLPSTGSYISAATFSVDSSAGFFISGTGSIKVSPTSLATAIGGLSLISYRVKKSGMSINASGGGYVIAWVKMEWPGGGGATSAIFNALMTTSGGGTEVVVPLAVEAAANGFIKYAFLVPNNSTVTALDLDVHQQTTGPIGALGTPHLWIDAIGFAGSASSAQQLRSFDVGGSMRSEGSFEIAATAGLGDVLLYTCPDLSDGFRPDLRRWQASGTSSADTGAVNGTYVLASAAPTFEAPASIFRPGAYAVLLHARYLSGSNGTVTVSAVTQMSSTDVGSTQTITALAPTSPDATNYYAIRVGVLDLPPLVVDPASGAKVKFTVTAAGISYRIDELLVFPLEESALTWIRAGDGAPSVTVASRVWLDAPSPVRPRGGLLVGNSANRSDACGVVPMSRGRHMLTPGRMLAYILASGSSGGASLVPRYFKRWHTNAAD